MPKLLKRTEKERASKLIKDLQANGMSQTEVAKKQGVSRAAIHQRIQKPYVQKAIEELLHKAGVTSQAIAEKIAEGMNAEKAVSADILVDENGTVKKDFDNYGACMVPDWNSRHKFIVTALELKKLIKQDSPLGPIQQIVQVFLPKQEDIIDTRDYKVDAASRPTNSLPPTN